MSTHIDELNRRRGGEESQIGTSHSFSAPTPYNTYFSPSIPGNETETVEYGPSTPVKSSGSVSFEAYPNVGGGDGDVSFGPSISSPSQDRSVTYSASNASAHLISPSRSRPFDPTVSVLPQSNLSIPAPPSRLSSADTKSSLIPHSDSGAEGSLSNSSSSGSKSRWAWRGRKKARTDFTQDDRDAQRLKQLGYDAVLGREYNFWSSLAITTLNIGALQVSHAAGHKQ
jgi:hypothetical protein